MGNPKALCRKVAPVSILAWSLCLPLRSAAGVAGVGTVAVLRSPAGGSGAAQHMGDSSSDTGEWLVLWGLPRPSSLPVHVRGSDDWGLEAPGDVDPLDNDMSLRWPPLAAARQPITSRVPHPTSHLLNLTSPVLQKSQVPLQ